VVVVFLPPCVCKGSSPGTSVEFSRRLDSRSTCESNSSWKSWKADDEDEDEDDKDPSIPPTPTSTPPKPKSSAGAVLNGAVIPPMESRNESHKPLTNLPLSTALPPPVLVPAPAPAPPVPASKAPPTAADPTAVLAGPTDPEGPTTFVLGNGVAWLTVDPTTTPAAGTLWQSLTAPP